MDNEETEKVHYHLEEDNLHNDDKSTIQNEKTPIQKMFYVFYFSRHITMYVSYIYYTSILQETPMLVLLGYNQPSI